LRPLVMERRLDTAKAAHASIGVFAKRSHRFAQLVGLGPILGIIDGEEGTACQRQGVVEGLGLGARRARRYADDGHVPRQGLAASA
jgi:hypothetical protein